MPSDKGYVLIMVLLVLAVASAAVIHFSDTVYGYANRANNFDESERMSLLLKSAYLLAAEKALARSAAAEFTADSRLEFEEKVDDTVVGLELADNNSRFNVNSLVYRNGTVNEVRYALFRRLLRELRINEEYADRLVDYIDADRLPRIPGSEEAAKNQPLFSLSELGALFPGGDLERLKPYVTVFGSGSININTAELPLLKALHAEMTEALARRIVEARKEKPFGRMGDLLRFAGMERIGLDSSELLTVKSSSFSALLTAEHHGLKETAEAGFEVSGGRTLLRYWREE